MIPEFGHFALIIALCLAVILAVVPMWGAWRGNTAAMALAPSLSIGLFVFVSLAFACLATAFLQDDFSVKVVAANSNSLLPAIYKFSAVWGNHEGSLAFSASHYSHPIPLRDYCLAPPWMARISIPCCRTLA